MQLSYLWLKQYLSAPQSVNMTPQALADCLNAAGIEVERIQPILTHQLTGVVVAQITQVQPHPHADRLSLCHVKTMDMDGENLDILVVCGANNVAVGAKVPLAQCGAVLPDGTSIQTTTLRGVQSEGMLCAARELGLSDDNEGLLILDDDAVLGQDMSQLLHCNDVILHLKLTPNRGDCLSVLGLAREICALYHFNCMEPSIQSPQISQKHSVSVKVTVPEVCPVYVGRCLSSITSDRKTPLWMRERLRRSGIHPVSVVVDVLNYVMLEMGQPLHAFDKNKLTGHLQVRYAQEGETFQTIHGELCTLTSKDVVIADQQNIQALAGVIGSQHSAVDHNTTDIFIEAAHFEPIAVIQHNDRHPWQTEASYRFRRGVDPTIPACAIDRATILLQELCGAQASDLVEINHPRMKTKPIVLRDQRIQRVVGLAIDPSEIITLLTPLGMQVERSEAQKISYITVPPHRFDLYGEEDCIEEIIRIWGYDNIPLTRPRPHFEKFSADQLKARCYRSMKNILIHRGYREVITYSFVSADEQQSCNTQYRPLKLLNPLSSEASVMRTDLWPGLLKTARYHHCRQQPMLRIFELGQCFWSQNDEGKNFQTVHQLAGLISGLQPVQTWGQQQRTTDFFDLKGDVEALLSAYNITEQVHYVATDEHPVLHPYQQAHVVIDAQDGSRQILGRIGQLHPAVQADFNLVENVFLFELTLDHWPEHSIHKITIKPAKFPAIYRDLCMVVPSHLPFSAVQQQLKEAAGPLLRTVELFDIYDPSHGDQEISLTWRLMFQHDERTLVDEEVHHVVSCILSRLQEKLQIKLRG